MSESRDAFEYPDEAGYPDGIGTLSQDQLVLIEEVKDAPNERLSDIDFLLVDNREAMTWDAIIGDEEIGSIAYSLEDEGRRLVLISTVVFPDYRNQGVANELIRRVLDQVKAEGKTITVMCPIVRTFVNRHPEYGVIIDPRHPGVRMV